MSRFSNVLSASVLVTWPQIVPRPLTAVTALKITKRNNAVTGINPLIASIFIWRKRHISVTQLLMLINAIYSSTELRRKFTGSTMVSTNINMEAIDNLRVCHVNCQSLFAHLDEFRYYFHFHFFHVICMSETWLK